MFAGIRKRAAIASGKDGAETLSASRAMGAIRRGEVAVLVIDAIECTESGRFVVPTQDFRLAELIANVGRACVVVVNKWDAVEKETNTLRVRLCPRIPFANYFFLHRRGVLPHLCHLVCHHEAMLRGFKGLRFLCTHFCHSAGTETVIFVSDAVTSNVIEALTSIYQMLL